MLDKFKEFIGINDDYEDYDEEIEEDEKEIKRSSENAESTYTPSSTYDFSNNTIGSDDKTSSFSNFSNIGFHASASWSVNGADHTTNFSLPSLPLESSFFEHPARIDTDRIPTITKERTFFSLIMLNPLSDFNLSFSSNVYI